MAKQITINEFYEKYNNIALIDVRSPAEFKLGHIEGAINIPLFTDSERSRVGTIYKQKGKQEAILIGLEIVGPKLKQLVKDGLKNSINNKLVIYCWRGGMRSGSIAWLYETAGMEVYIIIGGYKSYRRFVLEQFAKPYKLVMLGGPTGSKKTEILHYLAQKGEQIIDLEALAHHKGSAFGNLDGIEQPHTETFENNLAICLRNLNPEKIIWIEDESKTIGSAHIPTAFWLKMKKAPLIYLELPLQKRIEYLVEIYGKYPKENLQKAIDKIKKRLGGLAYKQALEALQRNDLKTTAKIMLQYYDAAYYYNSHKREDKSSIYHFKTDLDEVDKLTDELLNFIKVIKNTAL
ncbi:MAG: tRNA 2-selenouridine(34) synthase MnmH [Bacteroidia bacterium]